MAADGAKVSGDYTIVTRDDGANFHESKPTPRMMKET
jgi:predicted lipoprotein with Yx(FWY)xxD motif